MAAPTVIRVKRALDEQPLEALLVSSKRRKCNESNEEVPFSTVLTFAGTVKSQEESVHSHLSKALSGKEQNKDSLKKTHVPAVTEKLRERLKSKWQEDRFKVVNLSRFQGNAGENASSEASTEDITVLDIERHSTEVLETPDKSSESLGNYEYDLYYAESAADLCSGVLESVLSVQPYGLVSEAEVSDEDVPAEDSDNEDDENNWRNDYPDEESDENRSEKCEAEGGVDEFDDDLMGRMTRFGIGSGEELSDDEDDEALVYDRQESPFEDYKRRSLRQLREVSVSSSGSEADHLNDDHSIESS